MSDLDKAVNVVQLGVTRRLAEVLEELFDLMGIDKISWREIKKDSVMFQVFCDSPEDAESHAERIREVVTEWAKEDEPWTLEVETVAERDWSEAWKEFFHVVKVSNKLVIKPTWEEYDAAEGEHVIEIDPGMSFGSGHHFTSQSCLELMSGIDSQGLSFCDLGCGSGILSIGAAMLGFVDISAMDNNPSSIDIARENLERNAVAHLVSCEVADLDDYDPGMKYDVVAANMFASIIEEHAVVIAGLSNRYIVLAGILDAQFEALVGIYAGLGFHLEASLTDGEWKSGRLVKQ